MNTLTKDDLLQKSKESPVAAAFVIGQKKPKRYKTAIFTGTSITVSDVGAAKNGRFVTTATSFKSNKK